MEISDVFKDFKKTLKKTSVYGDPHQFMCESLMEVIAFDSVKKFYSKEIKLKKMPSSNDALYIDIDNKKYVFIEFKSGAYSAKNIIQKIYDSIIIFLELCQRRGIKLDFDFCRKNISYILVYNKEKEISSREKIKQYIVNKSSSKELKLFDLMYYEGFLLKEIHTYTVDEFKEKFLNLVENIN